MAVKYRILPVENGKWIVQKRKWIFFWIDFIREYNYFFGLGVHRTNYVVKFNSFEEAKTALAHFLLEKDKKKAHTSQKPVVLESDFYL